MSNTTNHTPTPWKAVEHNWSTIGLYAEDERCGGTVAVLDIQAEATEDTQAELETWMAANAALIVRAVNSHERLVEVVKEVMLLGERLVDDIYGCEFVQKARAALAAAGAA